MRSSFAAASRSASEAIAEILVEPQHLLWPQAGNGQHLQHAVGEFLAEFLETGVGAGPVQFGDDISDGLADAGDFGEPLLLDEAVEGSASAARLSAARE